MGNLYRKERIGDMWLTTSRHSPYRCIQESACPIALADAILLLENFLSIQNVCMC